MNLTADEKKQIKEILSDRANYLEDLNSNYQRKINYLGCVELALSREISRLRGLANRINEEMEQIESQRQANDDLTTEVERLETAIRETIEDNRHLADGENCTRMKLKRAINHWP